MKFISLIFLFLMVSCTKPAPKITVVEYDRQGQLMLKVIHKIINEADARGLNQGANAAEKGRVVQCHPVLKECEIYGKILSASLKAASDGNYTASERKKLKTMMAEMGIELIKGKKQLVEIQ